MKCSESERRIYCYRELNDRERAETDRHLDSCASCREIMENANAAGSAIKNWQAFTPALENESRMTSRVMDAVGKAQARRRSALRPFFRAQGIRSLQFAMAAVSLFLIVFFLGEYAKDSGALQAAKQYPATTELTIELDLAAFRSELFAARRKEQQNSTSIFQCMRDCLHNDSHNCADCLEKYSKR